MRTLILIAMLTACSGETAPAEVEKPTPEASDFVPSLEAPADVAAAPADAIKTESGLAYKVLKKGTGTENPDESSRVEVHYTGWTTDGKKFDSSRERGKTTQFGLKQVIAGWTEGLQLMKNGDHVRFWIPEELAYQGRPGKPAGMLVFDVELVSFKTPPKPPEAPANVAAAPADAQKTASGLAYKVVKKGPGGAKPSAKSMVTVHYAGWTTDGKNFDWSRKRGDNPSTFGASNVIAGWTEGLQLMETGDTYRFWIPEELAYEGKGRGPKGMLVFDVELLSALEAPDMAIPADVTTTSSGLKYKIMGGAAGGETAPKGSKLTMNWVGWTADGRGFDSNLGREPSHPVGQIRMIKGLAEGVELVGKGQKARLWIPEELAFNKRKGAPEGMVVYDIELVDFKAPAPKPAAKPIDMKKIDVKPAPAPASGH